MRWGCCSNQATLPVCWPACGCNLSLVCRICTHQDSQQCKKHSSSKGTQPTHTQKRLLLLTVVREHEGCLPQCCSAAQRVLHPSNGWEDLVTSVLRSGVAVVAAERQVLHSAVYQPTHPLAALRQRSKRANWKTRQQVRSNGAGIKVLHAGAQTRPRGPVSFTRRQAGCDCGK